MAEMSKKEIRKFLIQGTLTGKLGTVKKEVHMLFQFGSFWMKAMTKRGGGSKGTRRYCFYDRNGFAQSKKY